MVRKTFQDLQRRILALKLPKALLLSNIELDTKHKDDILRQNQVERDWYKDEPPFQSLVQVLTAYGTGRLVKVEPNLDYQPIMRLRNPKLAESYPGYLTAEAKKLLEEVGHLWRLKMDEAGQDKAIRLAITSLVRTQAYQNTIVKAGKLADPNSVHTRGEVFDIDASGYYLGDRPVNNRQNLREGFKEAFRELNAEVDSPDYADFSLYKPDVHLLLKQVLNSMQKQGKLHFVHEFPGTGNDVFHICRNPEYCP
ncbi:MAG TPA: DUF5715 family protein [Candidatus Nanoarchaeia archaeon]|nr:DUF5715 family protein [Candidatus Nanoarchaeia archaeon]